MAVGACVLLWPALFMVIRKRRTRDFKITVEAEHAKICDLFTISIFVANPLFGTIAAIEIIVVGLIVVLIAGNIVIIRRALVLMLERQAARSSGIGHQHAH
jgi:hypothetical protein